MLESFLAMLPDLSPGVIMESLEQLARAFPSMAAWKYCQAHFQMHGADDSACDELKIRVERQSVATINLACREIAGFTRLLTISKSSMVRSSLIKLANPDKRSITFGRGLPAEEGLDLAKELVAKGYEVNVVEDWELADQVMDCDAVILGADWVSDLGFINKSGSAGLVEVANRCNCPVYVVAEGFKLVNPAPRDASVYYQDWSKGSSQRLVKVFDWVSSDHGQWNLLSA